jgi:hypothetical protein
MPNEFQPNFELRAIGPINIDGTVYESEDIVAIGEAAPGQCDLLGEVQTVLAMKFKAFDDLPAGIAIEHAGETVAVIQAEHTPGDIQSAIQYRRVLPRWVGPFDPPPPAAAKPTPAPMEKPPAANSFDAEEAAAVKAAETATAAAGPDAPFVVPEGLHGLPERIAEALVAADLSDAPAIRGFIARGNDLEDLDEIGRAAVKKIKEWLEKQPTAPVTP